MDLLQNKLTSAEWSTIEKPVSDAEKKILNIIMEGYYDENICKNEVKTFSSYTKIDKSEETDYFVFKNYFYDDLQKTVNKYGLGTTLTSLTDLGFMDGKMIKPLKSSDLIRLNNSMSVIEQNKSMIFEYILIDMFSSVLKYMYKKKEKYIIGLYTLIQLKKNNIQNINPFVLKYVNKLIDYGVHKTGLKRIFYKSVDLIEKNKDIIKYEDMQLYSHQKRLFSLFKNYKKNEKEMVEIMEKLVSESDNKKIETLKTEVEEKSAKNTPMLVLYTAPTGTGKTLSPIGLSQEYKIIFVCVARHIGMALAKAAISAEKKIAFAFGCKTADDIRLHYYSAVEFTKNYKSGGIYKVDNSVGTNVEIIICDVQSYITSMHYMLAFNDEKDIITYWDEPTITLDYEEHNLHETIHNNWKENKISKVILSCATLPTRQELNPVFIDFKSKFENARLYEITSYDCKKSIPILNKSGYCVLPHYLYDKYSDMLRAANYCNTNKTLLRYFDLNEIINFVEHIEKMLPDDYVESYFGDNIENITMNKIKEFYLEILLNMEENTYTKVYDYFKKNKKNKFQNNEIVRSKSFNHDTTNTNLELRRTKSVFELKNDKKATGTGGILATTADAYTFTDGPTIYLTDEIDKIGQFYIQQTKIESSVFTNMMNKINSNKEKIEKIEKIENLLKSEETDSSKDDSDKIEYTKKSEHGKLSNESIKLVEEMNSLRKRLYLITLDPIYSPNTVPHQKLWAPNGDIIENAFVSELGEENTKLLMDLNIENEYKVLLLLGIGTFKYHSNKKYMEMMKDLADKQRLFMIIASTDYIYGTNYQFCHGFIGRDLQTVTQQKLLQALGRIGRNNIQQDYTIRFRDDNLIKLIFTKQENNIEARNLCALFSSD